MPLDEDVEEEYYSVESYQKKFPGWDEIVQEFEERFEEWELAVLLREGFTIDDLRKFPTSFDVVTILTLNHIGVNVRDYSSEYLNRYEIPYLMIIRFLSNDFLAGNAHYVGVGASSVVVSFNDPVSGRWAIKFGKNVAEEARFLKKIKSPYVVAIADSLPDLSFFEVDSFVDPELIDLSEEEKQEIENSCGERKEELECCGRYLTEIDLEIGEYRKGLTGENVPLRERESYKMTKNAQDRYFIVLDYVCGKTLEQLLDLEKEIFTPEQTLAYAENIFSGLLALKGAGIFHRDLWLGNIIIDEENDRAVIIDLGIATDDPDALAKHNRRYGSASYRIANDLVSLGQMMYKMATGEHIFTESKSMEKTVYAEDLKDHRDWIYGEPEERLVPYLEEVDRTVSDPALADIIKDCLTSGAEDRDYQRIAEKFEQYMGNQNGVN